MEKNDVLDFVKKKLDSFGYDNVDAVSWDSSLSDDLGVDSLDIVTLIMELEKEFLISLSDDFVYQSKTIGDLIDAVCIEINKKVD